ncbi:MAG: polysaccharide biosynthesis protein [Pedobacter sp.]|nr:MAG: polysaccharide biosynthesis protein [Pedobacter sp.]
MLRKVRRFFNRGHERSVKAKKNIFAMLIIKGISILVGLVLVPLTINYVSPARYGIWITLSSIIAWASFFDIGFGNGLKNKFTEAIAKGEHHKAKIYVSTTYAILFIITIILLLIFFAINPFIGWSSVLNASVSLSYELSLLACIIFSSFAVQFVLKLITNLLASIQKPALASLFDMLGQVLVLIFVFALTKFGDGSLPSLGLALGGGQIIVLLVATLWYFARELRQYAPSFSTVEFKYAKDLMSIGLKFFVIQIVVIVLYETNNIIIIQLFGPKEVTVYNVAYKYFSIIPMVFAIVISPFWVSFTDSFVKRDFIWMKGVLRKLQKAWLGLVILAIILVTVSSFVYSFWIKNAVIIPLTLTMGMGFYTVVNAWGSLHTQLLNGIGKLKIQLISAILMAIINIPMALFLGKHFGLSGLVWGQSLLPLITTAWWAPIQINKILNNKAKGIWNE